MAALIWVAPGGSQFSCIRIGGEGPTHKTPYMPPQAAINHSVEQLRYVLGSGSGVSRYCDLAHFGILDLMLQNLTQISHTYTKGVNFIHDPTTYFIFFKKP